MTLNLKSRLGLIQNYFLFVFIIISFQAVGIYEQKTCYGKDYLSRTCKIIDKILITKPSKFLIKTAGDLKLILENQSSSGRIAKKIKQTRKRFNTFNKGFNFYFEKGTRNDAGYLLLSAADPEKDGEPLIELWDINNQNLIHKWKFDMKKILKITGVKFNPNSVSFKHPLLMDDGGLVVNMALGMGPITKFSPSGEVLSFNNDYVYHHSIEIDNQGKIYVPIRRKIKKDGDEINHLWTEGFAILDKNLDVIETHFLVDIYKKAGLDYHIFSNFPANDPFHLNDVEPLRNKINTNIVLLSIKHHSNVLAYDLVNKEVLWILRGYFKKQHDPDFLNEEGTEISIFDNNVMFNYLDRDRKVLDGNKFTIIKNLPPLNNKYKNKMIIYNKASNHLEELKINIVTDNFNYLKKDLIPKTQSEGLSDFLIKNNSVFIEETNFGRLLEIDYKNKELIWQYFNKNDDEVYYMMAWSRRINKIPDFKTNFN